MRDILLGRGTAITSLHHCLARQLALALAGWPTPCSLLPAPRGLTSRAGLAGLMTGPPDMKAGRAMYSAAALNPEGSCMFMDGSMHITPSGHGQLAARSPPTPTPTASAFASSRASTSVWPNWT
ncbi:hypothetical protein AUP68_01686 [Ilyonectria robusta]